MKNLSKKINKIEQSDAWEDSDTVVELKVKKPLEKVIPIRLQEEHWQQITCEAKKLGIGPTTLARMWILEILRSKTIGHQDEFSIITSDRTLLRYLIPDLTEIELEIFNLMERGYPYQHISKILDISIDTINKLNTNILQILRQKQRVLHTDTSNKETNVER